MITFVTQVFQGAVQHCKLSSDSHEICTRFPFPVVVLMPVRKGGCTGDSLMFFNYFDILCILISIAFEFFILRTHLTSASFLCPYLSRIDPGRPLSSPVCFDFFHFCHLSEALVRMVKHVRALWLSEGLQSMVPWTRLASSA